MAKKKFPRVEKYLRKYGKFIVGQARKIIKKKGKQDTGKLLRSLKYVLKEKKGIFDIEFLSARHGDFIDKGVQGLGWSILPKPGTNAKGEKLKGSTAGMHGGAKLRPIRTHVDAETGRRKRSPYRFKTANIRSNIMETYVMRKGISIPNEDGSPMSLKSMAFIIGRAIKAKGIEGISFYSQPVAAFTGKLRKELMQEFERDVLDQIIIRKRKSGNL